MSHIILNSPIKDLNLSTRPSTCLRRYGVETVGGLVLKTENELMRYRDFGSKSLEEVMFKLSRHGFKLKDSNYKQVSDDNDYDNSIHHGYEAQIMEMI